MTDEEIQALQGELESTKAELEGITAEKEALASDKETLAGELETRAATITELEQTVGKRDSEIATLKETTAQGQETLTTVNDTLSQVVSAYKTAVAQANPAVPAELIAGDTIEAVDQSLENAKSLVSTVRASVEAEIASGKVPAGAPPRTPPDLESLSPREKINYAITKGPRS